MPIGTMLNSHPWLRSVVWVENSTGVVVQRDTVLTAGHVVCDSTAPVLVTAFHSDVGSWSVEGTPDVLACQGVGDLAVIHLSTPIFHDELHYVMPVHLDPTLELPLQDASVYAAGNGKADGPRLAVFSSGDVSYVPFASIYIQGPPYSTEGDSGGPLVGLDGQRWKTFGITSSLVGSDTNRFSPTSDPSTVEWLRKRITDRDGDGWGTDPEDAQRVIVVHTNQQKQLAVLLHDGSVVPLDSVGASLQASLEQGLVMVDAVEPMPALGDGASMPAALGLSADGTAVLEELTLTNRTLLGQRDRLLDEQPAPVAAMLSGATSHPPPRQDFASVYSRASGRLFVLGGNEPGSSVPRRDVWWQDVRTGRWNEVPLGEHTLGNVLAATRTFDGHLWVLDEIRKGWARFARLARIVPGTGEAEVLGTWPRLRFFDRHWMVLDRDGSVLMVASSTRLRWHTVVRIELADAGPRVDAVRFGRGALALSPSVDSEGYSFPIQHRRDRLPTTLRLRELSGRPGHWLDLGQCF